MFPIGYTPWNKGKKGYTNGGSFKKGQKVSLETRAKMSASKKGRIPHPVTEEMKQKIRLAKLGKKHTLETRRKMSVAHPKGELAPNWISDRSKLKRYGDVAKDRRSYAYNEWRKRVFIRDNFKCCMENSTCEGKITAHHIYSFTFYPSLRYKLNNGITLCLAHHPRKRAEEKRLAPLFTELVSVSK